METFIFKFWPQSWGGKWFFQAVPSTPCPCWNSRIMGGKQRGDRLLFVQNHRARVPAHPSNENGLLCDHEQWFIKKSALEILVKWGSVWTLPRLIISQETPRMRELVSDRTRERDQHDSSCLFLSVWAGVNLFLLVTAQPKNSWIYFLLASHLNILTYCKPPWQNSSAKDSSSALGLCLATFKCNNNIKTGSVYPFLKSVLTFRLVPGCLLTHILNSSVFILRFTLINADILIKRRFSCQCKPSPDVYGNNLSLVGWVWHLMFHVPTCFHASLIRLRLWNIAGFGVR